MRLNCEDLNRIADVRVYVNDVLESSVYNNGHTIELYVPERSILLLMARKNKKREAGSGSITKRKDGRWEGRYTAGYDPESGKRIIKNVLGKTQAEVKEKLKTAISESQRLDVSKAGNYTVASWVRTWYEVYAEPRIRPNTKAYYTNYIENHIIPGIGNISLDKLTTIQIQRFYNTL